MLTSMLKSGARSGSNKLLLATKLHEHPNRYISGMARIASDHLTGMESESSITPNRSRGSDRSASRYEKTRAKETADESRDEARQAKAVKESQRGSDESVSLLRVIAKETAQVRDALEALLKKKPGDGKGAGGFLSSLMSMLGGFLPELLVEGGMLGLAKRGGGAALRMLGRGGRALKGVAGSALRRGRSMIGMGAVAAEGAEPMAAAVGRQVYRDPQTGRFISKATAEATGVIAKPSFLSRAGRAGASAFEATKGFLGKSLAKAGSLASSAKGMLGGIVEKGQGLIGKGVSKFLGKEALKMGGKKLLSKIPLLGLLASAGFAIHRASKGDWSGAAMEAGSGLMMQAGYVADATGVGAPVGIGLAAASLGTDALLMKHDYDLSKAAEKKSGSGGGKPTPPGMNRPLPGKVVAAMPPAAAAAAKAGTAPVATIQSILATMLDQMMDPKKGIYVVNGGGSPQNNTVAPTATPDASTAAAPPREAAPGDEGAPQAGVDMSGTGPSTIGANGPESGSPTSTLAPFTSMKQSPNMGSKGGKFGGFGSDIDAHIKEASAKFGMPEDVLRGFVKMEGGWKGAMSPTGAIGTGQFTQGTWNSLAKSKAGQDIGMTNIDKSNFRKGSDPRFNKRINTLATALLAKQNAEKLKKAGLEVTGENLYMAHNIGAEGFIHAMKGQASPAELLAMRQNGMKPGMSPQDFVAFQKGRFNSASAAANSGLYGAGSMAGVTASPTGMVREAAMAKSKDSKAPIIVSAPTMINQGSQASSAKHSSAPSGTPVVIRNPDSPVRANVNTLIRTT